MHAALKRLLVALAWMARHMLTRPGWAAGLAAAEPGLLRRAFCPALGWSACVLLLAILPFGCGKDSTPSARQDEESPSPSPISDVPVGTVFYLGDHQHSPLVLTNARGEVIRTIAYQPYGSIRHQSGEGTDPFEFVANESDSGSGLGDFGARPYRHQAGIFLRPDPVAVLAPESLLDQPLRLAPYGYSGGDAINRADPHGEFWGAVLAGVASAIAITVTAQYANAPTKTNPQLKHKGLGELALQATATAISLFQGARAAVAIGSAGANIAQRALARVAETSGQRAKIAATTGGTESVQRVMSRVELRATAETGLVRGGRKGTHYATDAASIDARRAQQRLALPQRPELRVTLEVPKGSFSAATRVEPAYRMPGGGTQRTARGKIPTWIRKAETMKGTD